MTAPGPDRKVADIEILREMKLSQEPVVTSKDLAERTDYTSSNINYRLKNMKKDGLVDRKKVGARAVVWWITNEGEKALARA